MSKTGHILTGVALATAAYHIAPNAPVIAGAAVVGALLPDAAEGVVGWWGEARLSIIPHRTLTHWLYVYVALLFASHRLSGLAQELIVGLCAGALLHIALDAFSPMGIPLGNPFGQRTAIGGGTLYRTGAFSELPLLFVVFLITAGIFVFH